MERSRLIVKNFGPLKDIDIEVREMVTFIGAQASGKSTLAKLISILEDEEFRNNHNLKFETELEKYNILSYLDLNTFIKYEVLNREITNFNFEYSNNKYLKNSIHQLLSISKNGKVSYEDTEEALRTLKYIIVSYINLLNLIHKNEFYNLFSNQIQKVKFEAHFADKRIKKLKVDNDDIDWLLDILERERKIDDYFFLLNQLVNCFPNIFLFDSIYIPSERSFLHLISENIFGLINNNVKIPKYLLTIGQEYEKAINTIKELPLSIIDKKIKYKREGKTSYIYHNENEKVDLLESASGLQSIIPILLLVEYSKTLKEEYNFNFVVEEPELNLYPKAQHELIKYLVKNCLYERKNLILTTHSPFVLASINNLLLAHDKGQKKTKEVNKIIKKESWLNPKNFIAYELKNGKARKIMNDKLGQISENMIDSVSDSFADEFNKLLNL
ncbi:AAA family ATPase [Flavobacterium humidisoli]|uniref:ATP-binding protein n=1 Tax=Flavobacterium humidisoli TaxID=2937442 RepID=A0ABY4LX46_9FLAO|nr:AAA family ATPase [Flavobacterium humidisoli]UPZ17661.1 ATP-binding protein [Flavobacterium humidisoli]